MPTDLLSIEILLSGFLGYWIASGGNRAKYSPLYVAVGVLLFAIIGKTTQHIIWSISYPAFEMRAFFVLITPAVIAVSCGLLWRWKVGEWVFLLLRRGGITTQTFGPSNAWEDFAFNAGWEWFFIRVTLLDGTVFECNQVKNFQDNIPELSTDEEGNLLFVVTGKWNKDNPESEPLDPIDENGNLIFTHIPASQIARTDVHVKKKN